MILDIITNRNELSKVIIDLKLRYEENGKEVPKKTKELFTTLENSISNYDKLIDLSNMYAAELKEKERLIFSQVSEITKLKRENTKLNKVNENLEKEISGKHDEFKKGSLSIIDELVTRFKDNEELVKVLELKRNKLN